ncbi:unnamed protein product [Orchesella dallaii]|uniref:Aladin seven-bladed propeller domain-containing protein n=1 Tax=Orchesella dallaii TaxID=48710 RepID=A0ABP1RNJ7_9HEXA
MDEASASTLPTLELFPRIPRPGHITVAESHSELHELPSTVENPATGRGFYPEIVRYIAVDGNQLTSRLPFKIPSIRMSNNKASLLVVKNQGVPKAVWDAWWENGLRGVHSCLLDVENSENVGANAKMLIKALAGITAMCLQLSDAPSKLLVSVFPHMEWRSENVNEEFSHVRGWQQSWIRAIAWHSTASYLALALNDDTIRISVVGSDVVPMLRCQQQKNISCAAWRPFVLSELAVGCEDCVIIWHLTSSVSMKPGKDKTIVLKAFGHGPVNSVEYSSTGSYLLSSSAKDSSIYVWDTVQWDKAPLRRIGSGGIPLALWSPKSNRILAASPDKTFWVWENKEYWQSKRWVTPKDMIEAASWDPSGSVLLFATSGFIYGIFFELSPIDRFVAQTDSIVKPVYNIEECHVLDHDGNLSYKVGGKVRQMDWDKSGHRLAIMFDDSEMVAVFRVHHQSRGEFLAPLGFIKGHSDEYPLTIAFQKEFSEGANLTIAWSSGRIQYFPMIFALPTSKRNILHEDHYRTQNVVHGRPSSYTAAGFTSPRLSMSGLEPSASSISEMFRQQEEPTSPSRLYSVP